MSPGGAAASAFAASLRDEAAIGLPATVALTVAGVIRAARASRTWLPVWRTTS
jgi:hypothetical protein